MKNRFLLLSFLFFLSVLTAKAQDGSFELTGVWKNEQMKYVYHFKSDSSVFFSQSGYSAFINSYTIDTSKSPIWLDFTMKMGSRQQVIPALLEIVSEDEIIIEQFPPFSNHPVEFTENEYTKIRFKREKAGE